MPRPLLLALIALSLFAAPAAAQTPTTPLGLPCSEQDSIQFCASNLDSRVASWDGTPLEVDTLARSDLADRPLPVFLTRHGYSGGREGRNDFAVEMANAGYRVISYAARGHHGSCGHQASVDASPQACANGLAYWIDPRYETRDSQHLLGMLVDEGRADPQRLQVWGGSYGGGQAIALAVLNDQTALPDGSLTPWVSPQKKIPLRLQAAAGFVGWSDLAEALMPYGHVLDYALPPDPTRLPPGVPRSSWTTVLASGMGVRVEPAAKQALDYLADPAYDPTDPRARAAQDRFWISSPLSWMRGRKMAPLLLLHAWNDDLFSAAQAQQVFEYTQNPRHRSEAALVLADFGHPRSNNTAADLEFVLGTIRSWFHAWGKDQGLPPTGVIARTVACEGTLPQTVQVPDWWQLAAGEVRASLPAGGSFTQAGGDPEVDRQVAPLGGKLMCGVIGGEHDTPDSVRLKLEPSQGYTLMGTPTVSGRWEFDSPSAQVNARLWDIAPDGSRRLITRGVWRPAAGQSLFQLHASGWRFAPGHVPQLELLGADRGFGAVSAQPFVVKVRDLELRLPVREAPGSAGGQVQKLLPFTLPLGYQLSWSASAEQLRRSPVQEEKVEEKTEQKTEEKTEPDIDPGPDQGQQQSPVLSARLRLAPRRTRGCRRVSLRATVVSNLAVEHARWWIQGRELARQDMLRYRTRLSRKPGTRYVRVQVSLVAADGQKSLLRRRVRWCLRADASGRR